MNYINKKVIVRADSAGVFFGELINKSESCVTIKNGRKLFYWVGACAIEQLAKDGTSNPNDCKFTVVVEEMEIFRPIQIIPCTEKSIVSLEGVPVWKC